MIATLFLSAALGAAVMGLTAFLRGWGARRVNGWMAMANGANAASKALTGDRVWACVASGVCAYAAWLWWKSGGGDGTKRRLKSWARRAHPRLLPRVRPAVRADPADRARHAAGAVPD